MKSWLPGWPSRRRCCCLSLGALAWQAVASTSSSLQQRAAEGRSLPLVSCFAEVELWSCTGGRAGGRQAGGPAGGKCTALAPTSPSASQCCLTPPQAQAPAPSFQPRRPPLPETYVAK
jgi:hypothetical protein